MKKLLITLLFLLLLPLSASAEREKYIDEKFDFSKVKTIYVATPEISANVSDIKERELKNLYIDAIKSKFPKLKIKWLSPRDITDIIKAEQNIDNTELDKLDLEKSRALFYETVQKHADLVLMVNVFLYSESAATMNIPVSNTSTAYVNGEMVTIQTQSTQPYNTTKIYIGVRFDAVSTRDFKTSVLSIIDSREKLDSIQINMYKRILNTFFNELGNLFNENN